MKNHIIDGATITNWESFHDKFALEFKFPGYYGRNMDAWVDCMSDLIEPISLQIENVGILKKENKEIYDALVECSAFINWRIVDEGNDPIISLSYYA